MIGAVLSPNWDMWSLSKMRCVMSANVGGDDHESSNSCEQARGIRQNSWGSARQSSYRGDDMPLLQSASFEANGCVGMLELWVPEDRIRSQGLNLGPVRGLTCFSRAIARPLT